MVGDLVGSDESLDFFADTELGLEELDLDESFEDLVEVRLPADDTPELCLSLLSLEDCLDEEDL